MKLIPKIICAAVLAMPLLANAQSIKNETPYDMSFLIGSNPTAYELTPNQSVTVSQDMFTRSCAATPNDCTMNVHSDGIPNKRVLMTIVFNIKGDIINVKNIPSNTRAGVNQTTHDSFSIFWQDSVKHK